MYRTRRSHSTRCGRISREKTMKRTAAEIAEYIGGALRGDGMTMLESVASLKNAGAEDLSYAEEKFYGEIARSQAGCIIVQSGDWPSKTTIRAQNPKLSFARAAAWLLAEPVDDAGIHPSATVAPDAKMGEGVRSDRAPSLNPAPR